MKEKRNPAKSDHKILIVGSGSWATALLKILLVNGRDTYWLVRRKEIIDFVASYRHNPKYLGSVDLGISRDRMGTDISEMVKDKTMIILATPSAFIPETLAPLDKDAFKDKVVVSAVKGTVGTQNQCLFEYLNTNYELDTNKYTAITGPCHAEEVASEKLSYLTFSAYDAALSHQVSQVFDNRFIRTNLSADVEGTEYAAILKNIYAILAGLCQGVGMGDNFQAVLVSNAMQEMERFLQAITPKERNLLETCYMGDLLVTAYSQYSRNRTFGRMVGKGYSIKSAQIEMDMIAEGYYATNSIYELAQKNEVSTPLIDAVYHILYHNVAPSIEISLLSSLLNQRID